MPVMDFLDFVNSDEVKALYISAIMVVPGEEEADKRRQWLLMNLLAVAGNFWQEQFEECRKPQDELNLSIHVGKWLGEEISCIRGVGSPV